jgi:Tfp pilus assembly protein PilF
VAKRQRPGSAAPAATSPWLGRALVATLAVVAIVLVAIPLIDKAPDRSSTISAISPPRAPTPTAVVPANYVANAECLSCHAEQAERWRGSHHARAMAPASAETVLARFDGRTFAHRGVTTRFFQRAGKFVVRTDGPDGKLADFEVAYTFGVAPLQQYLIAQPGGRLQALQIAWDDVQKRWFHLQPKENAPAGDVLHWTGRYQNANTMCIACHTTGYEKRYDATADRFDSRWRETNVSCQACHGPGDRHVQWARSNAQGKSVPDAAGERRGLRTAAQTSARDEVDRCAACHSRRTELTASFVPGLPRFDQQRPQLLTASLYHADGQQLDEVFVDGSFRQSRMYAAGVRCTTCHDQHTGKPRREGNALCTHCHAPAPAEKGYPKATGLFDSPSHHFHRTDSSGAQCVACHMPSKTYMQIQARPDHAVRVPRPDLSVKLGTPNACTTCHAERPAQWAADQVTRWYGANAKRPAHYGETFAAARAGRSEAGEALARLAADREQPAIVRATALSALGAWGATGQAVRLEATRDPDPEIRAAAAEGYESMPAKSRLYALAPLLRDPVRAVRIAAARSLSSAPEARADASVREALDAALAEAIAVNELSLDMPGSRLSLAVLHENAGRVDQAERHYRAALVIDPDFTPARANLSRLFNAASRNADAERVLRDGLSRQPGIGELQYSLGLLMAEESRMTEAASSLKKAAALMPDRARVHLNLGLVLLRLNDAPRAILALTRSNDLDPADPTAAQALAVHYYQKRDGKAALDWARRWAERAPSDARARELITSLQRGSEPR